MKRVIIESPYAGDIAANLTYLDRCIADSLRRGEAPFASHKMYPGPLDDSIPEERKLGIEAGYAWWEEAELVVFYKDRGVSKGMELAMDRVATLGKRFEFRYLDGEE